MPNWSKKVEKKIGKLRENDRSNEKPLRSTLQRRDGEDKHVDFTFN
jgi:hypothetical protein